MKGTISLGQLVSFIAYIGMLVLVMFAIGRLFNVLERGNASYDRVNNYYMKKRILSNEKMPSKQWRKGQFQ